VPWFVVQVRPTHIPLHGGFAWLTPLVVLFHRRGSSLLLRRHLHDAVSPHQHLRQRARSAITKIDTLDLHRMRCRATIVQIAGAALVGAAYSHHKDPTTYNHILLAGLAFQVFSFAVFLAVLAATLLKARSSPVRSAGASSWLW